MNIIEVKNLSKSFPEGFWQKKRKVLHDISFAVSEKKATGFIGLNGSGKTTTLKCLLNFVLPEAGQISFFGKSGLSNEAKGQIGYLPERPYYHEFLSLKEFLKFHWDLSGGGQGFEQKSATVIKSVGLTEATDRKLKSFSKGMLQRSGLAQALIRDPHLLILDEPMSGLDPDGRLMMKELLLEQKNKGTAIFLSSHLLNDLEELCDDVVVIDQGKVLYFGSLPEWKSKYALNSKQNMEEIFREFRKAQK